MISLHYYMQYQFSHPDPSCTLKYILVLELSQLGRLQQLPGVLFLKQLLFYLLRFHVSSEILILLFKSVT